MDAMNNETAKAYIRIVIRKIDLRLMPFIFLLEFISYVNRVTMAYARNQGLKDDLHLTPLQDKLAVASLYIAYLIFAIPSVLVLRRIDTTIYLAVLMLAWGSLGIGCAFVTNGVQLIIVQFLIGMMIAGFFPGLIFYLSIWYHRNQRTLRIVIFYLAVIVAGAIGGILGYGIAKMDGLAGLNGWQWIYILIGIPVILLGFITLFFLNNVPGNVAWLNGTERDIFTNYLRDPTDIDPDEAIEKRTIDWSEVLNVFRNLKIWAFTIITVANLIVIKYWAISFPQLIRAIGFVNSEEQLMAIPPYFIAGICSIIGAIVATKTGEHGYCVMFFLTISSIGFILMATLVYTGQVAMYIAACVACSGSYPAFALLMAWLVSTVRGHMKKALAVSLAVGLGQIGGIFFPFINYTNDIADYRRSHIICAVSMAVAVILTFLLRFFLTERTQTATNEVLADDHLL